MAATTKEETEELKQQFETLKSDVSELVSLIGSTASKTADRTTADLSAEVARLKKEIKARGAEAVDTAETAIVNSPFQSLMIAIGLGFLIGTLTRR